MTGFLPEFIPDLIRGGNERKEPILTFYEAINTKEKDYHDAQ